MGQDSMAKFGTEILLVEFLDKLECDLLFTTCPSHFSHYEHNSTTAQATVADFGTEILLVEFSDKFE